MPSWTSSRSLLLPRARHCVLSATPVLATDGRSGRGGVSRPPAYRDGRRNPAELWGFSDTPWSGRYRVYLVLTVAVVSAYLRSPSLQPTQRRLDAGEAPTRALLATVAGGDQLEAAALMLSGFVSNAAMMHDKLLSDELIAAAVDIVLAGIAPTD